VVYFSIKLARSTSHIANELPAHILKAAQHSSAAGIPYGPTLALDTRTYSPALASGTSVPWGSARVRVFDVHPALHGYPAVGR
jgi:hypothetical protein